MTGPVTACTFSADDPCCKALMPFAACGETAICTVVFACIHEHVHVLTACAGCATEIQQGGGDLICPACEDGPESHRCQQSIRIAWSDGSPVTVVQEAA